MALNGKLVLDQVGEWVSWAAESAIERRSDPAELAGGRGPVRRDRRGGRCCLLWVTIKPLVRPSPAWLPQPSVKLNWGETLRPRPLSRIGVALEHDPGRRRDPQPGLEPGPDPGRRRASWSCSTWSTRR